MEVYSWENNLFLWAMASMGMLNNQRVYAIESKHFFGGHHIVGSMVCPFTVVVTIIPRSSRISQDLGEFCRKTINLAYGIHTMRSCHKTTIPRFNYCNPWNIMKSNFFYQHSNHIEPALKSHVPFLSIDKSHIKPTKQFIFKGMVCGGNLFTIVGASQES